MHADENILRLVDPTERWPLGVGDSVLYYRRLGLGELAELERRLGAPAAAAALEAALLDRVLVGWEGVRDRRGRRVAFSPGLAGRLPGEVRRLVAARALELMPEADQERRP